MTPSEYVAWLSKMTGRPTGCSPRPNGSMRLAPAQQTAYSWGDEIGKNNANCNGCGSEWDSRRTAPVGSFAPNQFGLYDMHGNVWEWVEDCSTPTTKGHQRTARPGPWI